MCRSLVCWSYNHACEVRDALMHPQYWSSSPVQHVFRTSILISAFKLMWAQRIFLHAQVLQLVSHRGCMRTASCIRQRRPQLVVRLHHQTLLRQQQQLLQVEIQICLHTQELACLFRDLPGPSGDRANLSCIVATIHVTQYAVTSQQAQHLSYQYQSYLIFCPNLNQFAS